MDSRSKPPAPPEKDRYTYDEMMDRLRSQRSGSSSRRVKVESADGVVEVKKRKRRSHQPKKEKQEKLNRLRKWILLTAIPLALLIVGLYFILNVRYQSNSFRQNLSQRATDLVGRQTTVEQLKIKGLSVSTRKFTVDTDSASVLQEAEFNSISGKLTAGSLLASDWHFTKLDALTGTLRFHSPSRSFASVTDSISISNAQHNAIPLVAAGFGISSSPEEIVIDHLRIGSTDFVWFNGRKEIPFVKDVTVISTQIGAETNLRISNGGLHIPGWPDFDITLAKVDISRNQIHLTDAQLVHNFYAKFGGEAILTGTVDLSASNGAPAADFLCQFDAMPVEAMIEPAWQGKIEGIVDTKLNFKANLSDLASLVVSGPFQIRNGSFGDITPTSRLAAFLAEPRMSRVEFHSIKGNVTISNGTRTIDQIEAVAPDFMKVTGSYRIQADGILDGILEVAISDKILTKIPGGKPNFFSATDPVSGMSSTPVQLSGTSGAPLEDLTTRIEAALHQHEIDSAAPPASAYPTIPKVPGASSSSKTNDAAKRQAEEAFEQLTKP